VVDKVPPVAEEEAPIFTVVARATVDEEVATLFVRDAVEDAIFVVA
jgi:hypothetical protein